VICYLLLPTAKVLEGIYDVLEVEVLEGIYDVLEVGIIEAEEAASRIWNWSWSLHLQKNVTDWNTISVIGSFEGVYAWRCLMYELHGDCTLGLIQNTQHTTDQVPEQSDHWMTLYYHLQQLHLIVQQLGWGLTILNCSALLLQLHLPA